VIYVKHNDNVVVVVRAGSGVVGFRSGKKH